MSGKVIAERQEGVLTLTLSNPDKHNAIDMPMYDVLENNLIDAASDESLRTLIMQGSGDSFAGGTDIRELVQIKDGSQGVGYEARMTAVQNALLALRIPVISVVRGSCVGGGLVLAALSDIVFCTPKARFGSPIARTIGNTMSATSLARLHACFGRRATAQMLLLGKLFSAQESYQAGFVTNIVEESDLERTVCEAVTEINKLAPLTLKSFKEFERRLDEKISTIPVDDIFGKIYGSDDFREGVQAFLEKRPPRFLGH